MGYIKEPDGVDFVIEGTPLTDTDRKEISEYIKVRKEEASKTVVKTVKKSTKKV